MRYTVSGADRTTGDEIARTIEAPDRGAAEAIAARSMYVSEIELAGGTAADVPACGNCGGFIGRLEPPLHWQGHRVCRRCLSRLGQTRSEILPARKTEGAGIRVAKAITAVAIGALVLWLLYILAGLGWLTTITADIVCLAVIIGVIAIGVRLGVRRT